MSFHLKSPAPPPPPAPVPVVDPAQTQNRVDDERRRRLASGGTQSTFLASAMRDAQATPMPANTLTAV